MVPFSKKLLVIPQDGAFPSWPVYSLLNFSINGQFLPGMMTAHSHPVMFSVFLIRIVPGKTAA